MFLNLISCAVQNKCLRSVISTNGEIKGRDFSLSENMFRSFPDNESKKEFLHFAKSALVFPVLSVTSSTDALAAYLLCSDPNELVQAARRPLQYRLHGRGGPLPLP
jgi:hypothetical protein